MAKKNTSLPWKNKIINHAQIGGIETSVLNDGLGKDVRIAWINTGTPLRYKVAIDRCMDIADAFYSQNSLAWLSHAGLTAPRPDANHGIEWLYSFTGGLLATCGLTNIGDPEDGQSEPLGLHGRIGNIPASLESIVQPDPAHGKLDMSITGLVKQSRLFGTNLELRRTISSTIGQPTIRIHDVVTNKASTPVSHMILYHCNFGFPLVDNGADILWKGKCHSRGMEMDNEIFNPKHNFKKCIDPIDSHIKGDEACGFIDTTPDSKGFCTAGVYNKKLSLALSLKFKKKQLPWLTNWQHWGTGEYVMALEPGTNPPIGQTAARKQKQLVIIPPGKSKTYDLEFTVLTDPTQIKKLINTCS